MIEKFENDLVLISVIIASYNSGNTIQACLNSLKRQATSHPFEIVVADSSTDGTDRLIENFFPEVNLIKLFKRTYPGPARNAAVLASRGEILVFLDTDCTVPTDWIRHIAKAHRDGWEVVGGAVLNGTRNSYIGTAEYISEFSEYFQFQKERNCRMIPTCNLSVRRKIFKAVGGFESVETESLFFKSEDELLCYRISKLGYKIHFIPNIRIYHHNRIELKHFFGNQLLLGFSLAIVRRAVVTKGSILVKYFPLSLLIPVAKTGILIRRTASYNFTEFLRLLFHLPLIFLGNCYYTIGFFRGFKVPFRVGPRGI